MAAASLLPLLASFASCPADRDTFVMIARYYSTSLFRAELRAQVDRFTYIYVVNFTGLALCVDVQ